MRLVARFVRTWTTSNFVWRLVNAFVPYCVIVFEALHNQCACTNLSLSWRGLFCLKQFLVSASRTPQPFVAGYVLLEQRVVLLIFLSCSPIWCQRRLLSTVTYTLDWSGKKWILNGDKQRHRGSCCLGLGLGSVAPLDVQTVRSFTSTQYTERLRPSLCPLVWNHLMYLVGGMQEWSW